MLRPTCNSTHLNQKILPVIDKHIKHDGNDIKTQCWAFVSCVTKVHPCPAQIQQIRNNSPKTKPLFLQTYFSQHTLLGYYKVQNTASQQ